MLIKIDSSVAEYIKGNSGTLTCTSPVIEALCDIALSYHNGEHLVISDEDTLEFLSGCQLLSELARRVYNWLETKYFEFYSLVDFFKYCIVAHKKELPFGLIDNKYFMVPIEQLRRISPSSLISEDLSDDDLYIEIARKYLCDRRINTIGVKFHKISGGGSRISEVIKNEINYGKFCLIIVDSDKEYPDDITQHVTAKEAQRAYSYGNNNHVVMLYQLQVREKENLIPPSFYLLTHNECGHKEYFTFLKRYEDSKSTVLRYLDIKEGVKVKNIKDAKWSECFKDYINEIPENFLNCKLSDFNNKEDDYYIINGIGDCTPIFKTDILRGEIKSKLQRIETKSEDDAVRKTCISYTEKIKISDNLFSVLPEYIKSDWIDITQLVLSWGCCKDAGEATVL